MKIEDILIMGLALVTGIGVGIVIMMWMKQQPQQPMPNPISTPTITPTPQQYYFYESQKQISQPQQQVIQQTEAHVFDNVLNDERMEVQRGPDGEFMGYTIHRDVRTKT